MKQLVLAAFFLLIASTAFAQPACFVSTDTLDKYIQPGQAVDLDYYPDALPEICIGDPYEAVITIISPRSLALGPLSININRITLTDVSGIPNELTVEVGADGTDGSGQPYLEPVTYNGQEVIYTCVRASGTLNSANPGDTLVLRVGFSVSTSLTPLDTAASFDLPVRATGDCTPQTFATSGETLATYVDLTALSSLEEVLAGGEVSVYPNPVSASSVVEFELLEASEVSLELYNLNGQLVRTYPDQFYAPGLHTQKLEVADLPEGVYFLRGQVAGFPFAQTLVKQ